MTKNDHLKVVSPNKAPYNFEKVFGDKAEEITERIIVGLVDFTENTPTNGVEAFNAINNIFFAIKKDYPQVNEQHLSEAVQTLFCDLTLSLIVNIAHMKAMIETMMKNANTQKANTQVKDDIMSLPPIKQKGGSGGMVN